MRLAVHSATTLRRTRKGLPLQRLPHAPPRESPRTHHATTIEGRRMRRARRLGHAPGTATRPRAHRRRPPPPAIPRRRSRASTHAFALSLTSSSSIQSCRLRGDRNWHRVRVRRAVEVVRMSAAIGNSAPKIACIPYPRGQRCRATIKAPRPPRKSHANHYRHPASIHSARC